MGCEIIDLQEYRDALEQKELAEVEALAAEVREAIQKLGPPEEPSYIIHDWSESDLNLLYTQPFYNYAPSFLGLNDPCPHCGNNPAPDIKSE